jgi:hypothetical protein
MASLHTAFLAVCQRHRSAPGTTGTGTGTDRPRPAQTGPDRHQPAQAGPDWTASTGPGGFMTFLTLILQKGKIF